MGDLKWFGNGVRYLSWCSETVRAVLLRYFSGKSGFEGARNTKDCFQCFQAVEVGPAAGVSERSHSSRAPLSTAKPEIISMVPLGTKRPLKELEYENGKVRI